MTQRTAKFGLVCAYVRGEEPNSPVVQAIALEENIARGRDLLEKELGKSGFEALLKSEPMQAVACNYHSVEDLLAAWVTAK